MDKFTQDRNLIYAAWAEEIKSIDNKVNKALLDPEELAGQKAAVNAQYHKKLDAVDRREEAAREQAAIARERQWDAEMNAIESATRRSLSLADGIKGPFSDKPEPKKHKTPAEIRAWIAALPG